MFLETPLIYSDPLSRAAGRSVHLKLEALQPSGSFKNRGIGHFCGEMKKRGVKEFICSSGGNAGLAASYAARLLGLPMTVVVPMTTSQMMIEKIRAEGAEVIQTGRDWQEADQTARRLCSEREGCYVPPFDDPLIWTGNATMIEEVARSGYRPDAVVLSVGGGGLYCGVVQGMEEAGWQDVPVYAVETPGAASFAAAIRAGHVVEIEKIDTVAKSLGARAVAEQAVVWAKRHPTIPVQVSDEAAVDACKRFASDHRLLVEPACGASLALCYEGGGRFQSHQNILVIVCGGAAV